MTCIYYSSITESSFTDPNYHCFDRVDGCPRYPILFSKDPCFVIKTEDIVDSTDMTTLMGGTGITHTTSFKLYRATSFLRTVPYEFSNFFLIFESLNLKTKTESLRTKLPHSHYVEKESCLQHCQFCIQFKFP